MCKKLTDWFRKRRHARWALRDPLNPGDVVRYNAAYFRQAWGWTETVLRPDYPGSSFWLEQVEAARNALMVVEGSCQNITTKITDVYHCRNLLTNETHDIHRSWLERIQNAK